MPNHRDGRLSSVYSLILDDNDAIPSRNAAFHTSHRALDIDRPYEASSTPDDAPN